MRGKLLVVAAGIVILAGALLFFLISNPARRGKTYLRELGEIEVGKTTDSELSHSAFSRHATKKCKQESCVYVSRLNNHLLASLRLSPATELIIAVTEEKGVVSYIDIHGTVVFSDTFAMVRAEQAVVDPVNCDQNPCVKIAYKSATGDDLMGASILYMSKGNEISDAINPGCLSKIGGCQNANEFMPMIYKVAKLRTGTR